MSSKIAAVFSKKNSSSSTVGTFSNDSMLTLVNEKRTSTNTQPRTQPLQAFGTLAGTYGYSGALSGPPPMNPSGSKKPEKARKAAEKAAAAAATHPSAPSSSSTGALLNTYGYSGALSGPPPVNPSGSSSHKARR
ncbi:hypothetical protein PENSPDRAFT_733614 [Peniophora sp. CONT]|nr:hypothetical protein PENSPDRAFT_733614 [Peniophora sp. CONT]